jgi:hypothetical protein
VTTPHHSLESGRTDQLDSFLPFKAGCAKSDRSRRKAANALVRPQVQILPPQPALIVEPWPTKPGAVFVAKRQNPAASPTSSATSPLVFGGEPIAWTIERKDSATSARTPHHR